jgi:hypothetical protein
VVAAATGLVPIYVDCTAKGQNSELQEKYSVKGYPTVLYLNPEGSKVKEMGSREAGALTGEIGGVAKKFPGRPSMWQNSLKGAMATGKAAKKPVALYVGKPDTDHAKLTAKLMKALGDRKAKLVWTFESGTDQALKDRGLESAPAIVVYDPRSESTDPLGKVTIKEGDDDNLVNAALDEVLKNFKK